MASPFGSDQSKSLFPSGSGTTSFASASIQPGLFGKSNAALNKPAFGSAASSNLFAPPAAIGSTTPLNSPSKPINPPSGSMIGSSSNIFGATTNPPPSTSTPSLFGLAPNNATQNQSNTPTPSTSTNSASLFAPAPPTATSGPAGGLFGVPAATSTPSTNLFGAPASQQNSKLAAEAAPSNTAGFQSANIKNPSHTASGGLFGSKANSTVPKQPSPLASAPAAKDQPTSSTSAAQPNALPTASAPAPAKPAVGLAPPSLLRGKTMEDLVTRWTSELDERTAEFKHMANEIAAWDQVLIQNGDQISNLYNELQRIEPVQSSIDQTLDYVESQQAELSAALDEYERQLSAHLPAQQDLTTLPGGRPRTAAQEREQAYHLAEDVHVQLNDMATSLGAMIAELNTLSGPRTFSSEEAAGMAVATPPEEDPIMQVGGILNAHLSSLNWIGDITQDLGSRLSELERRVTNTKVEFGLETRQNDLIGADDHLPSSRRSIASSVSSPYRSTPRR